MSGIRIPGPDGRTILVPIDDGAVGRISHTRGGLNRSVVYGSLVVSESARSRDLRLQRDAMRRRRETP